jgi:hypothetical protein
MIFVVGVAVGISHTVVWLLVEFQFFGVVMRQWLHIAAHGVGDVAT